MAIQRLLISKLLLPLSRLTAGWSERTRDHVFIGSGLLIFAQYFLRGMGFAEYRFLVFFTIDCVFFGLMILSTLKSGLQPVRFRKFPAFCWFGVGLLMLLSGVLVSENRFPEVALFLVAYPVTFVVWSNLEHGKIFRLLSRTCVLSFIFYTAINILAYPMGESRYAGLMRNQNGAAQYLVLVFSCLLVDLLPARKVNGKYVAKLVLMGLCVAQMYYTSSRTGYLGTIGTFAAAALLYVLTHVREKKRFLYRNIALGCLGALVCVNLSLYLFQVSKLLPDGPSQDTVFTDPNTQDPAKPDSQTSPDQAIHGLQGVKDVNGEKLAVEGKSLDNVSTGRVSVWKCFAADLNLLGHEDGKAYYIPSLEREISTAHNTILQVAYDSGVPSGILYLLYNLFSGVAAIWYAVRRREEPYALFPLAVTVSFGLTSLLATLTPSFYYVNTFYYYLVQFPLIAELAASRSGAPRTEAA